MEENFGMEWNMEENFSMEWKIFGMEWKWNGRKFPVWNMEKSSSISFHTMPCQNLALWCKILTGSDLVHVGGSKAHCLLQYFSSK